MDVNNNKDEQFFRDFAFRQIIYGGFWRRLGANLIDVIIFIPYGIVSFSLIGHSNIWLIILNQIVGGIIGVVYVTTMHALYGATLGKMATGLLVRRLDLTKIGWSEAIQRSSVDYFFTAINIVGSISTILAIPSDQLSQASFMEFGNIIQANQSQIISISQTLVTLWFWSEIFVLLFNQKKRAIHDYIADTVVVEKDSLNSIITKLAG